MSEDVARNTDSVTPPDAPAQTAHDTPSGPPASATPSSADVDQWRQRAEDAERELALRRALAQVDWFDAEDAYRELAPLAQRDAGGQWQIVLPQQRVGQPCRRLAPADAARELAGRKPHWVRARIFGGTGAGSGVAGGAASAGVTYAELLRPENAAKLREYLHERPDELDRLRQAHFRN